MYKPKFNHVLVEIVESLESKYNKNSGSENMGGEVYREGQLVEVGTLAPTNEHPLDAGALYKIKQELDAMRFLNIMWNEGHEAGTVFEHDGKKYALIYWFDIIGVKDEQ